VRLLPNRDNQQMIMFLNIYNKKMIDFDDKHFWKEIFYSFVL